MPLTSTCPGTNTVSALSTLKRRKLAVSSRVLVSLSVNLDVAKFGMALHANNQWMHGSVLLSVNLGVANIVMALHDE